MTKLGMSSVCVGCVCVAVLLFSLQVNLITVRNYPALTRDELTFQALPLF